jgi:HD-GYP domain-containing protein (c-di-GMP phosphodiesterase class II)
VWQALGVFSRGAEGAREVVLTRCERGADIARMLGFVRDTVEAIRALDEHWDGKGQPYRLKGPEIPLLARIVGLSQTVELYFSSDGVFTAYDMAAARRGTWFDPALVDALRSIRTDGTFWRWLAEGDVATEISRVEPPDRTFIADEDRLDLVAEAFARVIDAKSPWTYRHSNGVAELAVGLGMRLGIGGSALRDLRRAALLHDLGKLGVSNLILDKAGQLSDDEFAVIRRHPGNTERILGRVGCFRHLAELAGAHHERLDGRGYHLGRGQESLSMPARLLSVADVCDALRMSRPYRPALEIDHVLRIMRRDVGTAIDPSCFDGLELVLNSVPGPITQALPAARFVKALAEDYHQAA